MAGWVTRAAALGGVLLTTGCMAIVDAQVDRVLTPTGPPATGWTTPGLQLSDRGVLFERDGADSAIYAYGPAPLAPPPGWTAVRGRQAGDLSGAELHTTLMRVDPLTLISITAPVETVGQTRCFRAGSGILFRYWRREGTEGLPPSEDEAIMTVALERYARRLIDREPCARLDPVGPAVFRVRHFTRDGRPLERLDRTYRPLVIARLDRAPELLGIAAPR